MSDDQLRDALERAADVVPDRDLSATTWYAGRSRRRRTSRAWWGAGGAVAAAALVGAIAWNGGALSLPDSRPAGTAGDHAAQTSQAGPPSNANEQQKAGQRTILTFTSDEGELHNSGVLQPWRAGPGSATTWRLMDAAGQEPVFADGPGITLTYDGAAWAVRGCGLAMQAPGTVTDGRVVITDVWDIEPDPDPGAACVRHEWLDSARWESLLSGSPLVGQDGSTLLMSGTIGEQPVLERVSVGFARSDTTDPQIGPTRPATWDDLAQSWAEAPLEELTAQFPGREFVDTETEPEADVRLTSSGVGDVSITGCDGGGFTQSWLLDSGDTAHFLDPFEIFTAHGCVGPGVTQQSLVTSLLMSEAELTVHGDYLMIDAWVDPAILDPQPPVEDARPELLAPPTRLPDLEQLSRASTSLPEVLAVPTDGIPTLAEDPVSSFAAAVGPEDEGGALLVLGPDQRWRTAATGVALVYPSPHLLMGGSPPLLDTSISPRGDRLAYRTDESVVIVAASTGEAVEYPVGGEYPDNVPDDFVWMDDDRLAVDLGEDQAMIVDTSTAEVTRDAPWSQPRQITPWRIAVQGSDEDPSGPVVLQQTDTAGELVDEMPLGFEGVPGGGPALAEERVATVITSEDPSVIEPEGWAGDVPEAVSLVLAYDGTDHYVNVLQADAHTVTPLRWVDRGTLVVRVAGDGIHHYVLWDTQNGDTQLLTRVDPPLPAVPVFGRIVP